VTPQEIITTRINPVLASRLDQIRINMLAVAGGRPYIDERLSRFPKELSVDWDGGGASVSGSGFPGRRARTFLVNHCLRAMKKLNQFVFATPPDRENIDEEFEKDCTLTGLSIDQFMAEAAIAKTASRWCWIGIDRPSWNAQSGAQSVADKAAMGDRVYWRLWSAAEVADWHYDQQGLAWVITEDSTVDAADPFAEPATVRLRTLWTRDQVIRFTLGASGKVISTDVIPWPVGRVPFVCLGEISSKPWFFDDAEAQQRAIMDLQSAYHHALYLQMFSLLVLPRQAEGGGAEGAAQSKNLGVLAAVEEAPGESGITRYVTPDGTQLSVMRAEVNEVVKDFYRWWGQALQAESRQVASAESKAWDHLDTQAAFAELASDLEEAEREAVEISTLIDPSFAEYEPVYFRDFKIPDFSALADALVKLNNIATTKAVKRMVERGAWTLAQDVIESEPTEEEVQEFEDELANFDGGLDFEAIARGVAADATAEEDAGQGAGPDKAGQAAGRNPGGEYPDEDQGVGGKGSQG
jgi:hypothetical protein